MNITGSVVIHLNALGQPSPCSVTYWEITEDYRDGRLTVTVLHDGWLTASAYRGPGGWRISDTPREIIPAAVLAALPTAAQALLNARVSA